MFSKITHPMTSCKRGLTTLSDQLSGKSRCHILSLATGNPGRIVATEEALAFAQDHQTFPFLEAIYRNSGIKRRHIGFIPGETNAGNQKVIQLPLDKRAKVWMDIARPLATDLVQKALASAHVTPSQVGNLILTSSTDVRAPGLDVALINDAGVNPSAKRSFLGWMGCGAAVNGLDVASNWIKAQPTDSKQVVVHLAIDIPSVHMSFEDDVDATIFHSIMGDGCAVTVLGGANCLKPDGNNRVEVVDTFSEVVLGTEAMVTWGVGGEATLSKDLPSLVKKNIRVVVAEFLKGKDLNLEDVDFWCIHPGGPKIIQAVEAGLKLEKSQTLRSWEILENYGNMISPSLMFVVEKVLQDAARDPAHDPLVLALGFSPGVSVDGALIRVFK